MATAKKSNTTPKTPTQHKPRTVDELLADPNALREAYDGCRGDMAALAPSEVQHVIVNAPDTARLLLGRIEKLDALRPAIVAELPKHPVELLDRLPERILCFLYTYQQWELAAKNTAAFDKLLAEATELRLLLLTWAPTAVLWEGLTQEELDAILAGSGHSDIANDAATLGRLFVERWDKVKGGVRFAKAKAERAAVVGQSLLKALGERGDVESASVRAAKDEWERAYTLLVRAYAEVQAAVEYLRRHEGDAVELAPSLFSGRKAARKPVVVVTEPTNLPKEPPKL